jgi:hypothetical protein
MSSDKKETTLVRCPRCKEKVPSRLLNDPFEDDHGDEHWKGDCGHDWWFEGPDY